VVALRKADDTQGMLSALSRVEVLVRACPDELEGVAPELVRALMHCRLPEWVQAEAKR
jgi:telomere length regulation protein